ncbi:MAG: TerB family tellurite resistance protein [Cyanobacteria bacterium P01_F01_bin.143]
MVIAQNHKNKKLFKILAGTAWIDGVIQAEERKYLRRSAQELELTEDPEIKILLSELKTVQPKECYLWLEEYLEQYTQVEDYHELLERVGGIIYGNGYVDIRETRLLEKIQRLDPKNRTYKTIPEWVLRRIRRFYQKVVQEKIYG